MAFTSSSKRGLDTRFPILLFTFWCLVQAPQPAAAQALFEVNTTGSARDLVPGDGMCLTFLGRCSLRAAIEEANATPNGASPDVIRFTGIPVTGGLAVISLAGDGLPAITDAVVIDGTTAAGEVVLDGTSVTSPGEALTASGLVLDAGSEGSTVRGLTVGKFPWFGILLRSDNHVIVENRVGVRGDRTDIGNGKAGVYLASDNNIVGRAGEGNVIGFNGSAGIHLLNAQNNTIRGNYIGTDDTGFAMGNYHLNGFEFAGGITVNADSNIIGGPMPGMGNIIGFNNRSGIYVDGVGNKIRGNYIGADTSGRNIANTFRGILIHDGGGNTIGGIGDGMGNVIGFNPYGILLWAPETKIQGNYIGTNDAGDDLGNGVAILIGTDGGYGNVIGFGKNAAIDLSVDKGNVIAFNESGILIGEGLIGAAPTNNTVRGNSFYNNDELAIDLGADGPTVNDTGDADAGANTLLNFPDVTRAFYRPGSDAIVVEYSISTAGTQAYPLTVDAYLADDPASGEGKTFIGSSSYTSSGAIAQWEIPAGGIAWDPMDHVVLTVTDTLGNTSEFSPAQGPLDPLSIAAARRGGSAPALEFETEERGVSAPYPNPFSGIASVTITPASDGPVRARLFDLLGREVRPVFDGRLPAGSPATFRIDAGDLPAGVYVLRVEMDGFAATRRLALVR
ncbi:MAG: right-handed parallel beta-helix repeat-containing protein [Rhodothermales bacterium]